MPDGIQRQHKAIGHLDASIPLHQYRALRFRPIAVPYFLVPYKDITDLLAKIQRIIGTAKFSSSECREKFTFTLLSREKIRAKLKSFPKIFPFVSVCSKSDLASKERSLLQLFRALSSSRWKPQRALSALPRRERVARSATVARWGQM